MRQRQLLALLRLLRLGGDVLRIWLAFAGHLELGGSDLSDGSRLAKFFYDLALQLLYCELVFGFYGLNEPRFATDR